MRRHSRNKRKHPASKNDNSLGRDTTLEDGNPLGREPAIRKSKSRASSKHKKNNPKRRK
jgi:hypothetical protein